MLWGAKLLAVPPGGVVLCAGWRERREKWEYLFKTIYCFKGMGGTASSLAPHSTSFFVLAGFTVRRGGLRLRGAQFPICYPGTNLLHFATFPSRAQRGTGPLLVLCGRFW